MFSFIPELSSLNQQPVNRQSSETVENTENYCSPDLNLDDLQVPNYKQTLALIEGIENGDTTLEREITAIMKNSFYRIKENPDFVVLHICGLAATTLPLRPMADNIHNNLNASVGVMSLTNHAGEIYELTTSRLNDYLSHAQGLVSYLQSNTDNKNIPVIAIGHSTGCKVIETLMKLRPNFFTSYIAISPPTILKHKHHSVGLKLLKYLSLILPEFESTTFRNIKFPTSRNEHRKTPLEILSGLLGNKHLPIEALNTFQLTREAGTKSLKEMKIKMLTILGGRDSLVNVKATEEYIRKCYRKYYNGELVPKPEILIYENGSHQLQVGENKNSIEAKILDFIKDSKPLN